MRILSCNQMRALEQSAVGSGMSYCGLMETAGQGAAAQLMKAFQNTINKAECRVVSVCGHGNNGGDGIVAAQYLSEHGISCEIIFADGLPKTAESKKALEQAVGVKTYDFKQDRSLCTQKIKAADIIIDAVYGIGFHGGLNEEMLSLVEMINSSGARVLSVDLPSGAQCDSGQVENGCVEAELTVSFTTLKPVHVLFPSMDYCGKTVVLEVGIPQKLINSSPFWAETTDGGCMCAALTPRRPSSNKGSFGTLLAICGSYGMAGAAQLAVRAAYTCGVGLVKAAVTSAVYEINSPVFPEAVYLPLKENEDGRISRENLPTVLNQLCGCKAVLLGCGLGVDDDTREIVHSVITHSEAPIILDADALNIVSENPDILLTKKAPVIITPHPGEMARLCKLSIAEVQKNRRGCAEDFARKYGVIVVLKGAYTLITDGKDLRVNTTGNPAMARGGSGDVLAGMIGGLIAQGATPFNAGCAGVYIHGGAGDICRDKFGEYSSLASDIIEAVPEFLKSASSNY